MRRCTRRFSLLLAAYKLGAVTLLPKIRRLKSLSARCTCQVRNLQARVRANKHDTYAWEGLIDELRALNNTDELRNAYEELLSIYPAAVSSPSAAIFSCHAPPHSHAPCSAGDLLEPLRRDGDQSRQRQQRHQHLQQVPAMLPTHRLVDHLPQVHQEGRATTPSCRPLSAGSHLEPLAALAAERAQDGGCSSGSCGVLSASCHRSQHA
jgi:hypothetical protein